MIGFDLALGSGALLAPRETLAVLGHEAPTPDAEHLFRPGRPDLADLRRRAHAGRRPGRRPRLVGAGLAARHRAGHRHRAWSRSAAFTRPGARAGLWLAGLANAAMALGFGRLSRG